MSLPEEVPGAGRGAPSPPVPSKRLKLGLGIVAAILCLVAIPLPLWQMQLEAPQYQGDNALSLKAYGNKVVGRICEINELNHYIGMKSLGEPDPPCGSSLATGRFQTVGRMAPEMILWVPSALLMVLAIALATLTRNRWLRWLAIAVIWSVPLGVLVMTQFRLYQYGHELDEAAAFHPDPFTPRVLGPSKIYQFDVFAVPGAALWLIIIAALLVSVGPWLTTRYWPKARPYVEKWLPKRAAPGTAAILMLALAAAVAAPGVGSARADDMGDMDMAPMTPAEAPEAVATNAAGRDLAARLRAAAPGDTVIVPSGRYTGNFVVDTPMTLRGEGMPILDGEGEGTVLTITAAGTTVTGIHLMGSGPGPVDQPSGISVRADDVTVQGVDVMDTYMGIQVMGADRARILDSNIRGRENAVITGETHATGDRVDMSGMEHGGETDTERTLLRGDAVTLWNAAEAIVEGNRISDARDGVYLSFATDAILRDNSIVDGRYAIHAMYATGMLAIDNRFDGNLTGAILMYGGPMELVGNTVVRSKSPSTGIGLVIKDAGGVTARDNVLAGNRVGIELDTGGASNVLPAVILHNTIALNQVGVQVMEASNASFSRNAFVENTIQVLGAGDISDVSWSQGGAGNYWSSYQGYDLAGDGVGDLPLVQGGAMEGTLLRAPVLSALASGPAFRLLQAVDDRWAPNDPVVVDPAPLIGVDAPVMTGEVSPPQGPGFALIGALAVVLAASALLRSRRARTTYAI